MLSGVRRGKVKFPSRFPLEIHGLSDIGKSNVEKAIYVNVNRIYSSADSGLYNFVRQVLPGGQVSTVNGKVSDHMANAFKVKSLPAKDWPRLVTRSAWPSSPTVSELLMMMRRGISPLPFEKGFRVLNPVTLGDVKKDHLLATQIVLSQIVGIRSTVKIPEKFLPYFRYRWNFLILSTPWKIPIGLVRFLIALWKTNPSVVWLRHKMFFKYYLKIIPKRPLDVRNR